MLQQINNTLLKKLIFIIIPMIFSALLMSPLAANAGANTGTKSIDKDRSAMMKYRKLFMETKGNHAKAIKLLIKNKLSINHIVSHGEALAAMADDMLLIFPAGTMGGKSRAMQHIWDDEDNLSQDFKSKVKTMRVEATRLVDVAEQGNYKKIKKQMAVFANKGCRSCHSDYRGE
jgi:cytochrome c556